MVRPDLDAACVLQAFDMGRMGVTGLCSLLAIFAYYRLRSTVRAGPRWPSVSGVAMVTTGKDDDLTRAKCVF
jgi:hypothetical protein